MEKNGKIQKKKFKKEDKKIENKINKKRDIKEKEISEAKKIDRKKYLQKTTHHQLKKKFIPKDFKIRSNNALKNDHQTMELESDASEENEDDVESEEEISELTARKSSNLSKAPKEVKKFFDQEAKQAESNSEESDEENSNYSEDEEEQAEELPISTMECSGTASRY